MGMTDIVTGYSSLLQEVKGRIRSAQYDALRAVNKELIALYWDIGRIIVEQQQGDSWGQAVVNQLAADIQAEFPGIRGFSSRNIRYMRAFYLEYHQSQILQPMVAEIGWTHNLIVLERCKDDQDREFYLRVTRRPAS